MALGGSSPRLGFLGGPPLGYETDLDLLPTPQTRVLTPRVVKVVNPLSGPLEPTCDRSGLRSAAVAKHEVAGGVATGLWIGRGLRLL